MRCRAICGHVDVTVRGLDPVEGNAAYEEVPVTVECPDRVAGLGVRAEQGRGHAFKRGVLRVPRHDGIGPGLAPVQRVGEALPAGAKVVQAVVVPSRDHQVGVRWIDYRVWLVTRASAPTVIRIDVSIVGVVVARLVRSRVVAVVDARVGEAVVADIRLTR